MKTLIFYLANVLVFALPLATFEVWLERFKSGWDGEFHDPFWGRKINIRLLDIIAEKRYVTPYHLIMFGAVIPGLSVLEWIGLRLIGDGWLMTSFWGITIVPPLFLAAVWLGNAIVEDFLWFVINTYCPFFKVRFPDALQKLFRGEFKWHTKWVIVTSNIMLPRSYFTVPPVIGIMLFVQHMIVR